MHTHEQHPGIARTVMSRVMLLLVSASATIIPGWAAHGQTNSEPSSIDQQSDVSDSHMSEALRSSIERVVVVAGQSPSRRELTGTYEKQTSGLVGGMDEGARAGTITKDIGPVPVHIPIPIITYPAMIFGGLSGATKREIQEFRDALTEDLAQAANQSLRSEALATDVYHGLRRVPSLDTRVFAPTIPIPENTEAVLYVSVDGVTIDIQGKDAVLTTTARATLRSLSDGRRLDERVIQYQDRDTLGEWTENENALWHVYANFARHYLGREISAQVFGRVELRHELQPKETDSVARVKKNDWQGVSRSTTPTLAWNLTLLGGDSYGPWVESIDESNTYYDLEIYDSRTLVYAEERIQDPVHTLTFEIDPCKTYRWSVRPSYHVGSDIKNGEWMRFLPASDLEIDTGKGSIGQKASEAPAYIQGFATREIKCGRR